MVLANPGATGKSFSRSALYRGDTRGIGHLFTQPMHQIDQGFALTPLATLQNGKFSQRLVGLGQARAAQEG